MTELRHSFRKMAIFKHRWLRNALPGYMDRTLGEADQALVTSHLSHCEQCTIRLQELRRLEALLTADTSAPNLSFAQIWMPLRDRIRAAGEKPAKKSERLRRVGLALGMAAIASSFGVLLAFALENGGVVTRPRPTPANSATPGTTARFSTALPSGTGRPGGSTVATPASSKSTISPTPSVRRSGDAQPTASPKPSATTSPSPSESESATPSPTEMASPSPSPSGSSSGSDVGSSSPSPSPSSSH